MTCCPVGVGESGERLVSRARVAQAHGAVVRQVEQYALGCGEHVGRRARHRAAQHAYCVGDVRPRLCRAVKSRVELDRGCIPPFWRGGPRRRVVVGHQRPGHDSCGRMTGCPLEFGVDSDATLRRSDTGPSSSTFHRADSAVVNDEYSESGALDRALAREHARVGVRLLEAPGNEPRE
eukprot:4610015-Pleurochrysis_carterae.AAC.1